MKKLLRFLPVLTLALLFAEPSFAQSSTMGGLCTVMGTLESVTPHIVHGFAFILLMVGLGVGGWFVLDRERGRMGTGFMVGLVAVVLFALLWNLATPAQDIVTGLKGAVGC